MGRHERALLDDLYDSAIDGEQWPAFLRRLAGAFKSETATFRVAELASPGFCHSTTVGFGEGADQHLLENPGLDQFRPILVRAPTGAMLASHRFISAQEFQRTEHYAAVFQPNGNLYALGGHVERTNGRAVQIGVHRPQRRGPYEDGECRRMEHLSPHLARAARVMRLLDELETEVRQARAALDRLPFGVWMADRGLRCRWMNATADDALHSGLFGLHCRGDHLGLADTAEAAALRAAAAAFERGEQRLARVKLGLSGACLLLMGADDGIVHRRLGEADGLLIFLLDPQRAVQIDGEALHALYGLTPAELRLVAAFLGGLDIEETCRLLGIRVHTGRTQLKAVMRKTDSTRQSELMRKLLLGTQAVRAPNLPPANTEADP